MPESTAEAPYAPDPRTLPSGPALDEAVVAAIANATSENTRLNYRSQARRFAAWCHAHGVKALPAEPADVARYLTARFRAGTKIASIAAMRSAIGALHTSAGYPRPTDAEVVRKTVRGLSREAANTPRRRAKALTAEGFAAILATAKRPRRFGRRTESRQTAERRGADDAAIAALLFQSGLRRSEVAALTWGQIQPARTPDTVLVYLRGTKTDPTGNAADVRCLKNAGARAVLAIRPENPESQARLFRLNPQSIGRRISAAAKAAGIEGITGHSGRVGLACELTYRGASMQEVMLAGGWRSPAMVAHYAAGAAAEKGAVAKYL